MFRLILSILILTLLVTYAIIPFAKFLRRLLEREGVRIDKAFTDDLKEKEDEEIDIEKNEDKKGNE